ncbi:hypothetical protein NCAS_0A00770 [Naumovozyma castellii]|uniref:DNA repair protein RAD50 n=1 Tax=Naumovozyma castellii TaxID=27288 RepID=G0V5A1_NAUCA|nr:hypothetical protein NCAS_0A00770 [Naumovozyma castellii CBS 4309]CCC66637.1 hypothetical protein NCAS_0A00770 [Naumovozyma castellii CBS 4309]
MSAIYKLSIQGIRSFDSNDRETIEFGKPLTLIVGSNGSGKTTIIECLKYATTGDLPPNSKGGVFVHDPKITGEKDIRAQVKLAFTSANGITMIVTRNIQLLAKKTTNTFKTLEGQLAAINQNGDRTTLSTRSIELDTQVPLYLGVPKAILEYVIFCHQEDSLWPLSEPSNLKKKFDEIFQAMKFTKAIDNLKAIKKDMTVDIKLLKQSVEHLRVDRDRSRGTKMNIVQLQAQIDEYQMKVKDVEIELQKITEQSDKLFKSNQEFQQVLSKIQNLRMLDKHLKEEIENVSNSVELISLPKQELEELLANFSKSFDENEQEVKKIEVEIDILKRDANQSQSKYTGLVRKMGELQAREEAYKKNVITLESLSMAFSDRYNLGYVGNKPQEFFEKSKKFNDDLNTSFSNFEKESRNRLKSLENELSEITNSETIQNQRLEYSKADQQKISAEIEKLTSELTINEFTHSDLEAAKAKLNQYNEKLTSWENDDIITKLNSTLKEKNDQMIIAESDLQQIQERIMKTNQQADLFAKLALIKGSLKEKLHSLEKVTEKVTNDERARNWKLTVPDDLDMDFKRFYINLQKEIAVNNKNIHEKDKSYTEANIKLTNAQKEIENSKETEQRLITALQSALPEDCSIDEYDEVVLETELSYKTALENLKMHQTTLEFNRKALEIAERDSCCYLCSRKFETADFKSKLLQELKAKTDANFETTLKDTVKEEKEYLDSLRALERDVIKLHSTQTNSKNLGNGLTSLVEHVSSLKKELAKVEEIGNGLKEDRDHCEKVLRPLVDQVAQLRKETRDLEKESQDLSEELQIYGDSDGGVQTVDELNQQQQDKNNFMRQLRKDIQDLQNERESKMREHSTLLNVIKDRNLKINEIERVLQRKQNIDDDLHSKNAELKEILLRIQTLKTELIELRNKKQELSKVLNNEMERFSGEMEAKRKNLGSITSYLDRISNLKQEVSEFDNSGAKDLGMCIQESEDIQKEIAYITKDIEVKQNHLNSKKDKLKDSSNEKRNLEQNIHLANLRAKLKETENDISRLDIQNAEAERDKYQQESLRLRNLFEKLSAENAGKLGEIKQLQSQVDSLSQQLRSDYKDVDEKYHKEWVSLQTRTFVTDDIDTYSKALDSAIMRYHGLKMQDINRIIDELWKRTYSGTDIDTIKIRSDEVSSTVRGKSYNYRVVMYKQDAELDMRGRCSAGQKVLASIIIRLALSETFGINCGVIALDEPTTNLDEENIESLAKSLSNIIEMRRHQKNFQLIVITHDEKFLNHMNASQFTDHFFQVKRDDRQKSQIEWVDITKVAE